MGVPEAGPGSSMTACQIVGDKMKLQHSVVGKDVESNSSDVGGPWRQTVLWAVC